MDLKMLVGSIIRHALGAVGGILVAKGYIEPDVVSGLVETITGTVLAIGVVVYSYVTRKKLQG